MGTTTSDTATRTATRRSGFNLGRALTAWYRIACDLDFGEPEERAAFGVITEQLQEQTFARLTDVLNEDRWDDLVDDIDGLGFRQRLLDKLTDAYLRCDEDPPGWAELPAEELEEFLLVCVEHRMHDAFVETISFGWPEQLKHQMYRVHAGLPANMNTVAPSQSGSLRHDTDR